MVWHPSVCLSVRLSVPSAYTRRHAASVYLCQSITTKQIPVSTWCFVIDAITFLFHCIITKLEVILRNVSTFRFDLFSFNNVSMNAYYLQLKKRFADTFIVTVKRIQTYKYTCNQNTEHATNKLL